MNIFNALAGVVPIDLAIRSNWVFCDLFTLAVIWVLGILINIEKMLRRPVHRAEAEGKLVLPATNA